jgi:ribonucleoside-diphosphate reductase alpha chain
MAAPTIGKLSSMYMYAWKAGLKSTYYLRSRPATRIQQATVGAQATAPAIERIGDVAPTDVLDQADAIACSLENPESCEACQ